MKGIAYDNQRNKWRVRITEDKKRKHLGYFQDEESAINFLNNYKSNVMGAGNNEGKRQNKKKEVKEASTQTETEIDEILNAYFQNIKI
jgi:hypothetical protein